MKLFKNVVGRPSNETLRKRKVFMISICIIAVLLVGTATYLVVSSFKSKDIGGTNKNAQANRFVIANSGTNCYTVYAPTNAKYWRIHVYYKSTTSNLYGSNRIVNKNHYNDGVKSEKICFKKQKYNPENYRILVKWTTGANDKVNGNPNSWKPSGWYSNKSIGWAYKDYTVNWSNATLKLQEPSTTIYNNPTKVSIKVSHTSNNTLYYKFKNYNASSVTYTEQKCIPIKKGEVKSFTLDVNSNTQIRNSVIYLYSDSKCSNLLDTKKTKTYYYQKPSVHNEGNSSSSAKLNIQEPSTTKYTTATKVQIKVSHSGKSTLYYNFKNYNNSALSYNETNCIPIKKGEVKSFTLDVNSTLSSRYSFIALYSDSKCSTNKRLDSKYTKTYYYTADKLKLTEPSTTKYTKNTVVTIKFSHTGSSTLYYTFTNYNNGKSGYVQECSPINKGQVKSFTLNVDSNNSKRYSIIKLFNDKKCKNQVDRKQTKTYTYSKPSGAGTLKITQPSTLTYKKPTEVKISFSHTGSFRHYFRVIGFKYYEASLSPCRAIDKGKTLTFSLSLSKAFPNRSGKIYLYTDSSCKNQVDYKKTNTYKYQY